MARRRHYVVVGYDGSPEAHAAVTQGVRIARGRTVVIVHANDDRDLGESVVDAILLEGNEELADARYETRVVPGRPADALLDVARELDADTIVVGTRGAGRVGALLGSVAHELLQRSDRPVTVIPPRCAERMAVGRST
jgi:nucleotide-binding universal stress UspA family protein